MLVEMGIFEISYVKKNVIVRHPVNLILSITLNFLRLQIMIRMYICIYMYKMYICEYSVTRVECRSVEVLIGTSHRQYSGCQGSQFDG